MPWSLAGWLPQHRPPGWTCYGTEQVNYCRPFNKQPASEPQHTSVSCSVKWVRCRKHQEAGPSRWDWLLSRAYDISLSGPQVWIQTTCKVRGQEPGMESTLKTQEGVPEASSESQWEVSEPWTTVGAPDAGHS